MKKSRPAGLTSPQIIDLISGRSHNSDDPQSKKSSNKFIRPKRKRTGGGDEGEHRQIMKQSILVKPKAICNNPLDRFCELLLNWNIINENNEQTDDINKLHSIPDLFESYRQYISIWEPLFIIETKASIYSSLSLEENFGKCRVVPQNYEEKNSPVIKIHVNFGIEANKR